MSKLLDLPDELKLEIAIFLHVKDLYHLAQTCTRFSIIFKNEAAEWIELRKALEQKYSRVYVATSGERDYGIGMNYEDEATYWDTEELMDDVIANPEILPFMKVITFSDQVLWDLDASTYDRIDVAYKPHGKRLRSYLKAVLTNQLLHDLISDFMGSKEVAVKNGCTDILLAHILTLVPNLKVLTIRPHKEQMHLLTFFKTTVEAFDQSTPALSLPLQHLCVLHINQYELSPSNVTVEWVYWLLQLPNLIELSIDDVNGTEPPEDLIRTPALKRLRVKAWNFGPSLTWLLRNVELESFDYSQMVPHSVEYPFEVDRYVDALKVKSSTRLRNLAFYVLAPKQMGFHIHKLYSGPEEVPVTVSNPSNVHISFEFPALEVFNCDWRYILPLDGELDMPLSLKKLKLSNCPPRQHKTLEKFIRERPSTLEMVYFELEFGEDCEANGPMPVQLENAARECGLSWGSFHHFNSHGW